MHFRRATDEPLADDGTALYALVRDAAAPGRPDELIGMSEAVTWFAAQTPRRSRMPAFLAAAVATKTVLAATAASAAVGAVTVAGATGTLPTPVQDAAHSAFGAPVSDKAAAKAARKAEKAARDEAAAATPTPNLVGLCHAYTAGVKDSNGKALDNPAFTVLITAAGSAAGVDAFCVTTLAAAPGGKPTDPGSQAGDHKPTDPGSQAGDHKPAETGRP